MDGLDFAKFIILMDVEAIYVCKMNGYEAGSIFPQIVCFARTKEIW